MTSRSSRYLDESWEGKAPGTHGMQQRMRHMFEQLGVDLRETPASNLVFARSTSEAALEVEKERLIRMCWPVHHAVIDNLIIQTILCLGGAAGRWVREVAGATQLADSYQETNARGWTLLRHVRPQPGVSWVFSEVSQQRNFLVLFNNNTLGS